MSDIYRNAMILKQYLATVHNICPQLNQADVAKFAEGLSVKTLPTKSIYLEVGEVPKRLGFIVQGLMKAVYIDMDGNETNVNFFSETMIAVHYQALMEQTASHYRFVCLEPCTLIEMPVEHLQQCLATMPALERYVRLGLEKSLYAYMARTESLLIQNAEQRYLNFIEQNPDLFQRVSLSDLSSYLGIQRQSLTRIRQKLAQ